MCFSHPSLSLHSAHWHRETTFHQDGTISNQVWKQGFPVSCGISRFRLFSCPESQATTSFLGRWLPPALTKREGWKSVTVVWGHSLKKRGNLPLQAWQLHWRQSQKHVRNGAVSSLMGLHFLGLAFLCQKILLHPDWFRAPSSSLWRNSSPVAERHTLYFPWGSQWCGILHGIYTTAPPHSPGDGFPAWYTEKGMVAT